MTDRRDVFIELRTEYAKDVILESILNTVIVFLVINGVLGIFSTYTHTVITALIVSSLCFLGLVAYNTRKYYVDLYENRVPELREALRTAYETAEVQNAVVDQLFQDIREKLRNTSSGIIISVRSLVTKLLLIVFISFASISVHLIDVNPPQVSFGNGGASNSEGQPPTTPEVTLREDSDIYGEDSIIRHEGNTSLELQVQSFRDMLGNTEKEQESQTQEYYSREDIEGSAQDVYENTHTDDFDIIAKYNREIRKRIGE